MIEVALEQTSEEFATFGFEKLLDLTMIDLLSLRAVQRRHHLGKLLESARERVPFFVDRGVCFTRISIPLTGLRRLRALGLRRGEQERG
jgi:hypothetical protein